ncbi:MAG: hypothetical protein R3A10_11790 [Caldilineaceae bacterium]
MLLRLAGVSEVPCLTTAALLAWGAVLLPRRASPGHTAGSRGGDQIGASYSPDNRRVVTAPFQHHQRHDRFLTATVLWGRTGRHNTPNAPASTSRTSSPKVKSPCP